MTEIRRKLYKRGSSYETTLPMPLLFGLDPEKEYLAKFSYDPSENRWYVEFEEKEGQEEEQ